MPLRLAVVEDDAPFAEALHRYFALRDDVLCLAVFRSAEDALEGLPRLSAVPEVMLVDIKLPKMSGIDLVAHLQGAIPGCLCLILTMYEESSLIFEALKAGASGYLLKRTPVPEVATALLKMKHGEIPMSPEVARRVVSFFRETQPALETESMHEEPLLATREREVLGLLSKGHLYKEIGAQLGISIHTVNSYLRRIYEKLHVNSRSQAVAKYHGIK